MINFDEIINLIKDNNLNKNSSLEALDNILSKFNYSEADKQEVFKLFRSQGWFLGGNNMPEMPEKTAAMQAQPVSPPKRSSKKIWVSVIAAIIIVLLGCGLVYAYLYKVGPFSIKEYSEDNFFSNLLLKTSQINSSSYTVSGAMEIVPRDKDAKPFSIKEPSNAAELRQQYYYDSVRVKDAAAIISRLNNLSNYSSYYTSKGVTAKPYPESIKKLFITGGSSYYSSNSVTDPETNADYEYQVTDGGKNFLLTITFETDYAIKAIKNYGYRATSTFITDKKVSFTKDSSSYYYMSSEPPKPFLVKFGESLGQLPADISVKGSIGASSAMGSGEMADWRFNINGEGDFGGDLTYKVNADALKKDDNYYFKINNFPSIFLFGELSSVKGKWVSISSKAASSTDEYGYSVLSSVEKEIPNMEKSYKEHRDKATNFIKKVVTIADEEKLIIFKGKPHPEKVDGRQLIRYDLGIRKEAILPFYTKLREEIDNDPDFSEFRYVVDQGLVDYLKSDEFDQVFTYLDQNNTLVFWTDKDGFPAIAQNATRIVPPDTATQLKDKQINVVFKFTISDINKPLNINAPSDSVPLEKLISDYEDSLNPSRLRAKSTSRKAYLDSIRSAAEIVYDTEGSSYGKNPFPLGPCKQTSGTLFADSNIVKYLESATDKNISLATCVSKGTYGNVSSYAISVPLPDAEGFSWCIDSTGSAKQIIGVLKSDVCK